jgi:hypothetical protein
MNSLATLVSKHGPSAAAGVLLGLVGIAVIGVRTPGGMMVLILVGVTAAILGHAALRLGLRLVRGRSDAPPAPDETRDP